MRIVSYQTEWRDRYAHFLKSCENALFFHSLSYLDFLCELLGSTNRSLLALDEAGQLLGVLPLLRLDGLGGIMLNSLPFYGSHGGTLAHNEKTSAALLDAYNAGLADERIAGATLVENLRDPWSYAKVTHRYVDVRIGQITPIAHPDDHAARLMKSYHFKTRNMVRKGQRSGLRVVVENGSIDVLAAMHKENLAALGGIAKPNRFFDLLNKYFVADSDYKLYLAYKDDHPVSALLLFYFGSTVEYYVPATDVAYRELQPLSLLIFEAMIEASRAGYRWWNWGGTWKTQEGVYRFKSRWGTKDYPYRYYTALNNTEILSWSKEKILSAYPFFYVAPFSALVEQAKAS